MKTHLIGTIFCLGLGTPALALIGEVLDTAGDIAKGTTDVAASIVDPSRRRETVILEESRPAVVVEKRTPAVVVEEPQEPVVVQDEDDISPGE